MLASFQQLFAIQNEVGREIRRTKTPPLNVKSWAYLNEINRWENEMIGKIPVKPTRDDVIDESAIG